MGKEQVFKKIELTDVEIELVDAIWNYRHEGGKSAKNFCSNILGHLMYCILDEHGYEMGLGERADWDRDSWKSIIVYYRE